MRSSPSSRISRPPGISSTLREGDLAYLHVHPMDTEPDGPVNFMVSLPSAGTYAMFFDFKVDNVVRTARFVVDQP